MHEASLRSCSRCCPWSTSSPVQLTSLCKGAGMPAGLTWHPVGGGILACWRSPCPAVSPKATTGQLASNGQSLAQVRIDLGRRIKSEKGPFFGVPLSRAQSTHPSLVSSLTCPPPSLSPLPHLPAGPCIWLTCTSGPWQTSALLLRFTAFGRQSMLRGRASHPSCLFVGLLRLRAPS